MTENNGSHDTAAIAAYAAAHELEQKKKHITEEINERMERVRDYLEFNPGGFEVMLENKNGVSELYQVCAQRKNRVAFDRKGLQDNLELRGHTIPVKGLTAGAIALFVEQGTLTADDVEGYEESKEAITIKKTKVKKSKKKRKK